MIISLVSCFRVIFALPSVLKSSNLCILSHTFLVRGRGADEAGRVAPARPDATRNTHRMEDRRWILVWFSILRQRRSKQEREHALGEEGEGKGRSRGRPPDAGRRECGSQKTRPLWLSLPPPALSASLFAIRTTAKVQASAGAVGSPTEPSGPRVESEGGSPRRLPPGGKHLSSFVT